MQTLKPFFIIYVAFLMIVSCQSNEPLPFIGQSEIVEGDTIKHKIASFEFLNQNNEIINNAMLKDHIYIADFFFTSCPSICPKVRIEMLKIYDAFEENKQVKLVSHTIDPKRDTVEKLKRYANNLEVDHNKWYFLTGDKHAISDMAAESYFVSVTDDPKAPGGFEHSGKMLLIDKGGHIRAYSDGTNPKATAGFIKKIKQLLKEYE